MDDAVRIFGLAETIGGMDERNTGQEGSLLVLFGISDIDAFFIMVPVHDQADVFPFGEAGALPLLIIQEQVPGTGGSQESIDISPLAVADQGQLESHPAQGFHNRAEVRI